MDSMRNVRKEVVKLLKGGGAHADFDQAVQDFPVALRGKKPDGAPHTAWELLEHLRIAQWDMLEFSRGEKHSSPKWPDGYWPASVEPESAGAWDASVASFRKDNLAMQALVADAETELSEPFVWGKGQTLLREALQMADHNAYHIGELVFLRRLLGAWKAD